MFFKVKCITSLHVRHIHRNPSSTYFPLSRSGGQYGVSAVGLFYDELHCSTTNQQIAKLSVDVACALYSYVPRAHAYSYVPRRLQQSCPCDLNTASHNSLIMNLAPISNSRSPKPVCADVPMLLSDVLLQVAQGHPLQRSPAAQQ